MCYSCSCIFGDYRTPAEYVLESPTALPSKDNPVVAVTCPSPPATIPGGAAVALQFTPWSEAGAIPSYVNGGAAMSSLLSSGQTPSVQSLAINFQYENLEATSFSALSPAWVDHVTPGTITLTGASLLFDEADVAMCQYNVTAPGGSVAGTESIVAEAMVLPPDYNEARCPVPEDLPPGALIEVYYAPNGQDFTFTGFQVMYPRHQKAGFLQHQRTTCWLGLTSPLLVCCSCLL